MKSLSLIVCLILTIGYINRVEAVTDAELEALEKQIEQQEVEDKQQAESEAKRKAEQKRKTEAEAEKKRLVELEKKQRQEEARLAEIARQNQEEETTKKRAEEEKKEKHRLLIDQAEKAIQERNKDLAIMNYKDALSLYPEDRSTLEGLETAEKLVDKACLEIVGAWEPREFGKLGNWTMYEDGTWDPGWWGDHENGVWECLDPKEKKFVVRHPLVKEFLQLKENEILCSTEEWYFYKQSWNKSTLPLTCWRRNDKKSEQNKTKKPSTQQPSL